MKNIDIGYTEGDIPKRLNIISALTIFAILILVFSSLTLNFDPLHIIFIFFGAITFFLFIFYPEVGLVLTLMAIHNPYYNYAYLALRGLRGGAVRASISTGLISMLLFAIFLRMCLRSKVTRLKTPLDMLIH